MLVVRVPAYLTNEKHATIIIFKFRNSFVAGVALIVCYFIKKSPVPLHVSVVTS